MFRMKRLHVLVRSDHVQLPTRVLLQGLLMELPTLSDLPEAL